jgi:hypothetical protein
MKKSEASKGSASGPLFCSIVGRNSATAGFRRWLLSPAIMLRGSSVVAGLSQEISVQDLTKGQGDDLLLGRYNADATEIGLEVVASRTWERVDLVRDRKIGWVTDHINVPTMAYTVPTTGRSWRISPSKKASDHLIRRHISVC